MLRPALAEHTGLETANPHYVAVSTAAHTGVGVQLSLHHDLCHIEAEWRAFEVEADGTAFQTFDWVSTWQRHIGSRQGVTPAIIVGRHHGRILLILPLAIQGGCVRRITWLAAHLNNCNAPLLARDFADVVNLAQFSQLWREAEGLLRKQVRYDLIDLDKIPETVGGQANPLTTLRLTRHPSDSYVMRLVGTWDALYTAKRSSSWRKTDGKRRRRLEKFGTVVFATAEAPAEIEQSIDTLIKQKTGFYGSIGVVNIFKHPGVVEFHKDLANRCHNLVHVSHIKVGSAIVAASFGLTFHYNYDYVLAGYSLGEFVSCSPGTIHMQALMKHFLERGFKTFDFNIGDSTYKQEWRDIELKLYDYVKADTILGWFSAAMTRNLRALKGFVKRSSSLYRVAYSLRSLTGRLRG